MSECKVLVVEELSRGVAGELREVVVCSCCFTSRLGLGCGRELPAIRDRRSAIFNSRTHRYRSMTTTIATRHRATIGFIAIEANECVQYEGQQIYDNTNGVCEKYLEVTPWRE